MFKFNGLCKFTLVVLQFSKLSKKVGQANDVLLDAESCVGVLVQRWSESQVCGVLLWEKVCCSSVQPKLPCFVQCLRSAAYSRIDLEQSWTTSFDAEWPQLDQVRSIDWSRFREQAIQWINFHLELIWAILNALLLQRSWVSLVSVDE